jgi:hypothetical protein
MGNSFHAICTALMLSPVFVLSSCAGLQRTPLDTWEKKEFKDLGISIDLPSKVLLLESLSKPFTEKGKGYMSLNFYLHPVYSSHAMAEPIYLVTFCLRRLTGENYTLFQKEKHSLSFYWEFKDHYTEFYPSVTNYVAKYYNADGYCYRKDIKCSNGDVVLVTVMYSPLIDNKANEPTDIDAIKRIINSVTILDDKKK